MLEPSDWPAWGKVVQGGAAQGSASLPWGPRWLLDLDWVVTGSLWAHPSLQEAQSEPLSEE